MTIDEAIEILNGYINRTLPNTLTEGDDAIKLGIEALKLLEKRRRFAIPDKADLLPGETKE